MAVAGLATFGASCGGSDNTPPPPPKQLAVSASDTDVTVGTSVTFTAKVGNTTEAGAEFYIDNKKVTNPYKFDKEGNFNVVAKKNGFKDSNPITIKVSDVTVAQELEISASKTEIEVGESVTFTAKVGTAVETGAEFYIDNKKVTNPYKFDLEGVYNVVAKKVNFKDSAAIKITVTKKDTKSLVLTATPNAVEVGQDVNFSVKDNTGGDVTGATITLAGVTVTNPWKATAAGTYKFKATKTDYNDSAEVTVTVTEPVVPQGNYVKVGTNYSAITQTRLYIQTNAQNQPLVRTLNDGTNYLVYELVSFTGNSSYSLTTMAVIISANATQLLWPSDVPAANVLTIGVINIVNSQLDVQSPQGETITAVYTWGAKATQNTPGKVNYGIGSTVMEVKFDGDYAGLYAAPQSATLTAKKNYSLNSNSQKLVNFELAK